MGWIRILTVVGVLLLATFLGAGGVSALSSGGINIARSNVGDANFVIGSQNDADSVKLVFDKTPSYSKSSANPNVLIGGPITNKLVEEINKEFGIDFKVSDSAVTGKSPTRIILKSDNDSYEVTSDDFCKKGYVAILYNGKDTAVEGTDRCATKAGARVLMGMDLPYDTIIALVEDLDGDGEFDLENEVKIVETYKKPIIDTDGDGIPDDIDENPFSKDPLLVRSEYNITKIGENEVLIEINGDRRRRDWSIFGDWPVIMNYHPAKEMVFMFLKFEIDDYPYDQENRSVVYMSDFNNVREPMKKSIKTDDHRPFLWFLGMRDLTRETATVKGLVDEEYLKMFGDDVALFFYTNPNRKEYSEDYSPVEPQTIEKDIVPLEKIKKIEGTDIYETEIRVPLKYEKDDLILWKTYASCDYRVYANPNKTKDEIAEQWYPYGLWELTNSSIVNKFYFCDRINILPPLTTSRTIKG